VGADDIAFGWCRMGSNGLLDDRPIRTRGIHDGPFSGLPQKEDRMPANDHVIDAVRCAMLAREQSVLNQVGEETVSLVPLTTDPVFI